STYTHSKTNIDIFFFQAEDGIRDFHVTGVQTCALPIFAFAGGLAFTFAAVAFGLAHPAAQRFSSTTDFGGNRADRSPLRLMVVLVLHYKPNRPLTDFRGILRR